MRVERASNKTVVLSKFPSTNILCTLNENEISIQRIQVLQGSISAQQVTFEGQTKVKTDRQSIEVALHLEDE